MLETSNQGYQILIDKSSQNGRTRPWREKKLNSLAIADSYTRIGYDSKSEKVRNCSTYLTFKQFKNSGDMKLHQANFCKVRLCSTCAWRRSLKIFSQVSTVMNELITRPENKDKYRFLFLTLTVRNVNCDELAEAINNMLKGYRRLFDKKAIKDSVVGAFRALEITYNHDYKSESFDTFHPHFHVILVVRKEYFSRHKEYISQEKWTELWKTSCGLDYTPIVDIRKVSTNNSLQKNVNEVAKYTVKDADLLLQDTRLMDKVIKTLDNALDGRRLISFRGILADIQKELGIDDAIDGDLINTGEDVDLNPELDYILRRFRWHAGVFNYCELDQYNEFL